MGGDFLSRGGVREVEGEDQPSGQPLSGVGTWERQPGDTEASEKGKIDYSVSSKIKSVGCCPVCGNMNFYGSQAVCVCVCVCVYVCTFSNSIVYYIRSHIIILLYSSWC